MTTQAELEQAINLSMELVYVQDSSRQELKIQVNQFLKEFENSDVAWKYGLQLFLNGSNEQIRFYGISRVSDAIGSGHRFKMLSLEDRALMRETLMKWLSEVLPRGMDNVPKYIKNKVSVVIARLVKYEYPSNWSNPFEQFLAFANMNESGVELLLKVLDYVTEEVTGARTEQSQSDIQLGVVVRDRMREAVLLDIVEFWFKILSNYRNLDRSLVSKCLCVIEEYICWIDISLVVSDRFLRLIFHFLQETTDFRVHAVKYLLEVVRKGMPPENKAQLVRHINVIPALEHVYNSIDQNKSSGNDEDDDDEDDGNESEGSNNMDNAEYEDIGWGFQENLSALICTIGMELIDCKIKLPSSSPVVPYIVEQLSVHILPMAMFKCLGSNNLAAQLRIQDLINRVLGIIRENADLLMDQKNNNMAVKRVKSKNSRRSSPSISEADMELDMIFRKILPDLLPLLLRKMCYPRNFRFDPNDEYELEFERNRQALMIIFTNVTRCAAVDAVLPFLRAAVMETCNGNAHPYESEVVVSMVYAFGEGAPTGIVNDASRTLLDMARLGNSHRAEKNRVENIEKEQPPLNDEAKAHAEDVRRSEGRRIFLSLVTTIYSCYIGQIPLHRKLQQVFNDIIGRYSALLLNASNEFLGSALRSLAGVGGIRHPDAIVRSQASYILVKLAVSVHMGLQPFANDILNSIKEYLVVSYDLVTATVLASEEHEGIVSTKAPKVEPWLCLDDIMNVYELSGVCISMSTDERMMSEYLFIVLSPIRDSLEMVFKSPTSANKNLVGHWAAECTRAIAAVLKGLGSKWFPGTDAIFRNCTDIALQCLGVLPDHDVLRSRILTLLHCIVNTLGENTLDFTPRIAIKFLEQSNKMEHVLEAMQFVNQLVTKFKGNGRSSLDEMFLPVVSRVVAVFQAVSDPFANVTGASLASLSAVQQEYRAVKRIFAQFMYSIAESKQDSILYSNLNAPHLASILRMVGDDLATFPDSSVQKSSVRMLQSLAVNWLHPSTTTPAQYKEILAMYLMEHGTLASFRATSVASFRVEDYENANLLEKICAFHQVLYEYLGQNWLQHLVETTLPSVSCPREFAVQYAETIVQPNVSPKQLREAFKRIFLAKPNGQ